MKITQKDCLEILRRFHIASVEDVPKQIDRLTVFQPSPTNTGANFRYKAGTYVILFDNDIRDQLDTATTQLRIEFPNIQGEFIQNPALPDSYSIPYEGKDVYLYEVDAHKQRLDTFLASTHPEFSRSSWQKHIKAGRVSVDGASITSPKYEVSSDNEIAISLEDAPTHDDRELPVLYMDDDIIVINKPIGVLTHRKNPLDTEFTVADFFRRYTTHGLDTVKPGIVHRLDRDTSGVLIGARTPESYDILKSLFSDRRIQKTYTAIVDGKLGSSSMTIDVPIARNPKKPGTFRPDPQGKSARTELRVLSREQDTLLVSLRPHTGRTHQLRVHCAYIGAPIRGDRLYSTVKASRMYLHASKLAFTWIDGSKREFEAPLPDEFEQEFSRL